jgi:hypothetical protein
VTGVRRDGVLFVLALAEIHNPFIREETVENRESAVRAQIISQI